MKTSKINIPIILEFRDYHDIDFFGSDLQRIIPLIRWKEIDFDRGNYLAIYYFNITIPYLNIEQTGTSKLMILLAIFTLGGAIIDHLYKPNK